LPAAARIVEELAPDNEAIAIVEVAEDADLEYLPHRTNVTVIATVGTGNGDGESVLAQLVAAQPLPCGRGYCWFAGEAGQSRAVQKYLRGQHHWDAAQFDILGYWRRDSEAWDNRYAPVASDLFAVYEKALADGKSDKLASEEFDDALEQAGL
jgi:NADPH-dependent ferric siderophore reductase